MNQIFQDDFLGGFLSFCIRSGFSKEASIRIFQKFALTKFAAEMEDYLEWAMIKSAYGDFAMPEPIAGPSEIDPEMRKRQLETMKTTTEPQLAGLGEQQRWDKIRSNTPGMDPEEYRHHLSDVSHGDAGMTDVGSQFMKGLWGPQWGATSDLKNMGRAAGNWYDRTFSWSGMGGPMAPSKLNAREEAAKSWGATPGGNETLNTERGLRGKYQKFTGLSADEGARVNRQTETLGGMSPENYNKRLAAWNKRRESGGGMYPGYSWSPQTSVAYPSAGTSGLVNPMNYFRGDYGL